MKKQDRISAFVRRLETGPGRLLDPRYRGYFACFNAQRYYEAHDVLEHLWLETRNDDHLFFKGLIQVAGAFVHMQKQFQQPEHPKHGSRLRPAARLLQLGVKNLLPYAPWHFQLHVSALLELCERYSAAIIAGAYVRNPWSPAEAPRIELLAGS